MIEIYPRLFVGAQSDYEQQVRWGSGWRVVQACRDPYHREALGYKGRGAPKDDPEYLIARRQNRLILNMLDHDDPSYIHKRMMDASLEFMAHWLDRNERVLVHCNQGNSRGPSIGLLYLGAHTDTFAGLEFHEAERRFRDLYPPYSPRSGVRGFLSAHWSRYCRVVPQDGEGNLGDDHGFPAWQDGWHPSV
jgi:hypothetical protein